MGGAWQALGGGVAVGGGAWKRVCGHPRITLVDGGLPLPLIQSECSVMRVRHWGRSFVMLQDGGGAWPCYDEGGGVGGSY